MCSLFCGDSRELMAHAPPGLVVTDPPYNIGMSYDGFRDNLSAEDYAELIRLTCRRPCVIIHYVEGICSISSMFGASPDRVVAWVYQTNMTRNWRAIAWWGCKPDFARLTQPYKNPNDKRIQRRIASGSKGARLYDWWNVNLVKNVSRDKTEHPCQIPVEVIRRILKITDCRFVIDPFCGSGTTLLAARRLGIPSIGIEQSPRYCEIAARRLSSELPLVFA